MQNLESFLSDVPKDVEVSREGSHTDIIVQGTAGRQAISMIYCAAMTAFMGIIILKLAVRHCGIVGDCQIVGSSNNMFLFVAGVGMFLVSLLCLFFVVRAWKTKTIIQVDSLTGNFSMFSRTPWGEGKHLDFSSETAVPVIREIANRNYKDHQFEVYPTLRESKEGLGIFKKNPNVFVVTNWNHDKCKWVRRLILTIQKKDIQNENDELT